MPRQQFKINEDYFKVIDSEEKAYMLGFIYADGNVSDSSKDKHYRLRITLENSDIKILNIFKNLLGFEGDIKVRELKSNQRDTRGYYICELSVSNKILITDLVNLGVVPNKTFNIQFPSIPQNLYKHFIRGFFDGDGSIYLRKDRPNGVNFEIGCASLPFITKIVNIFANEKGIKLNVYTKKNMYILRVSQHKARELLHWLYRDSNIYLDRKYKLYKDFIAPLYSDV